MPLVAGAAIQAGTSLIGGFLGSSAANKAAKQRAATGEAVAKQIDKSTGDAISAGYAGMGQANDAIDTGTTRANQYISDAGTTTKGLYGDMTAGLQPYRDAGTYGLSKMQSQGDFSFNPSNLENDPGYQFQLQQGLKSIQASAAGRGMLSSGSALKSIVGYNQGLAGTSYQNAYNRALSTFDTNRAGYQSLAGMGQNANSQAIQAGGIYGGQVTSLANMGANTNMQGAGLKSNVAMLGNEYVGSIGLQGAEASGQARIGSSDAISNGLMNSANAWSGALKGVGNAAMTYGLSSMGSSGYDGVNGYEGKGPGFSTYQGDPTMVQAPQVNYPAWNPPPTPSYIGGGGATPSR